MMNILPELGASQWSAICDKLGINDVTRVLNKLAQLASKSKRSENVKIDPTRFLGHGQRVTFDKNLHSADIIQPLHIRLLALDELGSAKPKDISLAMNSYAKIYKCMHGENKVQLKSFIQQLFPRAKSLLSYMNEQDFSLVLNCMSKINMLDDDLLRHANRILASNLSQHANTQVGNGLFYQMTPQGISLVLNAFAKSNVPLDHSVLLYIVKDYLPKHLDEFLVKQLVVLLHACVKFNIDVSHVKNALEHLDKELANNSSECTLQLISTALYTFAKYNYMPQCLSMHLSNSVTPQMLKVCNELELSNIYYAMAKLNLRDESLLLQLNVAAESLLSCLSMQALSNIYYTLSRLDFKIVGNELNQLLLQKILNRLKAARILYNTNQLLPLHMLNICLGMVTNTSCNVRVYNKLLGELCNMGINYNIKDDAAGIKNVTGGQCNACSDNIRKFISSKIGTQGMYQLHVIILHLSTIGLQYIDFWCLKTTNLFFDEWQRLCQNREPHANVLFDKMVEPDLKTSHIHNHVESTLKQIYQSQMDEFIIYNEHKALPFTIDVVLYRVGNTSGYKH